MVKVKKKNKIIYNYYFTHFEKIDNGYEFAGNLIGRIQRFTGKIEIIDNNSINNFSETTKQNNEGMMYFMDKGIIYKIEITYEEKVLSKLHKNDANIEFEKQYYKHWPATLFILVSGMISTKI